MLCHPDYESEDNEETDVVHSNDDLRTNNTGKLKVRSEATDAVVSQASLNKKQKRSNDSPPLETQPGGIDESKESTSVSEIAPHRSGKYDKSNTSWIITVNDSTNERRHS